MLPSSISKIFLDGKNFYVKRDDLLYPNLAGNKFRKLYSLLNTPESQYNTIISYGGTQSNAMLAIAFLCKMKGWNFLYYTKTLSRAVKEQRFGNFYESQQLGMRHEELENEYYREFVATLRCDLDERTFLLDQGGANELAQEGVKVLAEEIESSSLKNKSLAIPSGTGTTALFLALALPEYKVYTVACIGDTEYLKMQMKALHTLPKNLEFLELEKKYHFAKPYEELFSLYKKLLHSGIEFDLLYAPLMWKAILSYGLEDILYIHSGGVSGNSSMLQRYKNKGYTL